MNDEDRPSQTPPPEEKLTAKDLAKDVLGLIGGLAYIGVVLGLWLCAFVFLSPRLVRFYLEAKDAILQAFASGNYAYGLGRIVGTLIATALFWLLLKLAIKLQDIAHKAILK